MKYRVYEIKLSLLNSNYPYQTDRYVTDICHSSVKYMQNICMKVSVTYLQHIGIWPQHICHRCLTDICHSYVTDICHSYVADICHSYMTDICVVTKTWNDPQRPHNNPL